VDPATKVVDLAEQSDAIREQAAELLVVGFHEPGGWADLTSARAEVVRVLGSGFARVAILNGLVLGWIGGLPQYDGRVWELHPLVVRRDHRRRAVGRTLVEAFEFEAARRGALTLFLGSDDDAGMTSLSSVDLYRELPQCLAEVRDLGRGHPFLFYHRCGFHVTGVLPDANGPGRPDIHMCKRVGR